MLVQRELFKVRFQSAPFAAEEVAEVQATLQQQLGLTPDQVPYFCTTGAISNAAYVAGKETILIKTKTGELIDIAKASDLPTIEALGQIVTKHYLCYPKLADKNYTKIHLI